MASYDGERDFAGKQSQANMKRLAAHPLACKGARQYDDTLAEALLGGPVSKPATGLDARPGRYVAAHRIRPLIAAWIIEHDTVHSYAALHGLAWGKTVEVALRVQPMSGRDALSFRAGMSRRTIDRILNCDPDAPRNKATRWVSIDTVDRLFVAMGCSELLYRDPSRPDGVDGFADVYFHPAVIGMAA